MAFEVTDGEQGEWAVLHVSGEMDLVTSPVLRQRVHEAVADGRRSLVLDLSAVVFCDSSGVGVLVATRRLMRSCRGRLRLILPADVFTQFHRSLIIELAARFALPATYPFRYYVVDGGLMSYGIDQVEQYRGAARYVDRILKGEKAGDLPVQMPTRFQLTINVKTAKALNVPATLLARADEVIE